MSRPSRNLKLRPVLTYVLNPKLMHMLEDMQDMQNTEIMQNMKYIQNMQKVHNLQDMQNMMQSAEYA